MSDGWKSKSELFPDTVNRKQPTSEALPYIPRKTIDYVAEDAGPLAPYVRTESLYKPEYAERAKCYCQLGATDFELGEMFGVSDRTINTWRNTYSDFADACKIGKETADSRVERAFYHRACGYSHKSTKFFAYEGEVIAVDYIEHVPPEHNAIKFWLTNRKPKEWRDKVTVDGVGPEGAIMIITKDDENL